jgi:hypothetical protein
MMERYKGKSGTEREKRNISFSEMKRSCGKKNCNFLPYASTLFERTEPNEMEPHLILLN